MSLHHHYRSGLLLKEERFEMHSTHHNQLKFFKLCLCPKKRGLFVTILQQRKEGKNQQAWKRLQKKWLGGCSQYSHTRRWAKNSTTLALVPLKHIIFHRLKLYTQEFWETSYLKKNFIPPRWKNNHRLSFTWRTQSFLNPTIQQVSQIHWTSHNSTSGGQP